MLKSIIFPNKYNFVYYTIIVQKMQYIIGRISIYEVYFLKNKLDIISKL